VVPRDPEGSRSAASGQLLCSSTTLRRVVLRLPWALAPCNSAANERMILIFETPTAYSVNFDATLSGESASFSPNQCSGGYTGGNLQRPELGHGIRERPCDTPSTCPSLSRARKYQVTTRCRCKWLRTTTHNPGRIQDPGHVLARQLSDSTPPPARVAAASTRTPRDLRRAKNLDCSVTASVTVSSLLAVTS
jgi:hypothetical protein